MLFFVPLSFILLFALSFPAPCRIDSLHGNDGTQESMVLL